MKVAIIRQQYNPFGGAEVFVSRTLTALSSSLSLTVLARSWSAPRQNINSDKNIGEKKLATNVVKIDPFYLGRVWRDASFALAVTKHLRQYAEDYAIVQSHERIVGSMVYRAGDGVHRDWLPVLSSLRQSITASVMPFMPYHRYVMAAESAMFNHPALKIVICNSPMIQNALLGHFPVLKDKLRLVYNGIDTNYFSPKSSQINYTNSQNKLPLADKRLTQLQHLGLTAIFVGSGFERKGLATAIRAVAAVTDAQLIVVGNDKNMRYYQKLATRLNANTRIHFFGAQKELAAFYHHADVLIFPTHYEPFGNVTLEALASGLPVLTSPTNGAAILIDSNKGANGEVIAANNPHAYAEALLRLRDKNRYNDMALAARESALPFNLDNMREAMLSIYRELS